MKQRQGKYFHSINKQENPCRWSSKMFFLGKQTEGAQFKACEQKISLYQTSHKHRVHKPNIKLDKSAVQARVKTHIISQV